MQRPHSETRFSRPYRALARVLAFVTLFGPSPLLAAPQGEQVVNGTASFDRQGNLTQITASDGAIINYTSFDIASQETVQFLQPDAASRVLNRIGSLDPTQIDGSLLANGIVYLVNPAGVYFGGQAIVDVAGLYAAAGAIDDTDFLARRDRFTQLGGAVINLGEIQGDVVSLIGQQVANRGTIASADGLIALVAGGEVVLVPVDGRVRVRVSPAASGVAGVGVENAGVLDAGAGQVNLAAGDLYSLAIQQSGDGSIFGDDVTIEGQGGGNVEIAGSISAISADGQGGSIRVLGEQVALQGATLHASGATGGGTILVGGDYQGANADVRNATNTHVDAASTLRADALASGDGGRVIVWSDDTTRFDGTILARGADGVGGFAEISGKQHLGLSGHAYLGGGAGAGSLLLDPGSVAIVDGGNTAPPGTLDTINDGWLNDQLDNGGADVAISTANSTNAATEDLTVDSAADIAWSAANNLTLAGANSVTVNGTITSAGTGNLDLVSSGGAVAINNAVSLAGGKLTVSAGTTATIAAAVGTGGGDFESDSVGFTSTAAGTIGTAGGDVDIDATTGDVALGAGVTTGGGSFQSSGDALTVGGTIAAGTGSVTATHDGDVAINQAVSGGTVAIATDAAITVSAAVTGTASATLHADQDGDNNDGGNADDLAFDAGSSVEAPSVTLKAGADAPGAGNGAAVTGLANATIGAATTALAIRQDANLSTAGVPLASFAAGSTPATYSLQSDDGSVTVAAAADVSSTSALTVSGGTGVSLPAGLSVASLDASAAANDIELNGAVTSTGTQTYQSAVTLNDDVTLSATAVSFQSTVDSEANEANSLDASAAGTTSFAGRVGSAANGELGDLTTNAATLDIAAAGADVTTTGAQNYQGAVTLAEDTRLDAGGDIEFDAAVNSPTTARALVLNTAQLTRFAGAVGGGAGQALLSVTTNAGGNTEISGAGVTTTGDQIYNDNVRVTGATTALTAGGNVRLLAGVDHNGGAAATTLTVTADDDIELDGNIVDSDATGPDDLTLTLHAAADGDGVFDFVGPAPEEIHATSVTLRAGDGTGGLTTAAVNDLADVVLRGPQGGATSPSSYTLRQDAAIADAPDTTLFAGGLPQSYALRSDDASVTVATAARVTGTDLALAGQTGVSLSDAGGYALASLDATATTGVIALGGGVTTTGDQDYNSAVQLDTNVTLAANDVRFDGTVRSPVARSLAVNTSGNGQTVFGGAVGDGGQALLSVTTNADGTTTIAGGGVTTTGNQTYGDATTVSTAAATLSAGAASTIALNGATTLNQDLTIAAGTGTADFNGAMTGANDLASNATTTNLDNTVNVASVDSGATTIGATGGSITTTGNQSYGVLQSNAANTTLTGTQAGSLLTFENGVSAAGVLTISTNTDQATPTSSAGAIAFDCATASCLISSQGNLTLTRTGTQIPVDSSIAAIFDGNLTVQSQTGFVNVGAFNKLAAAGNLTISAATTISVSDLNAARNDAVGAVGRITLTAPGGITVLTRAPANASDDLDGGVDWVANFLTLNAPSLTLNDPAFEFRVGLPDADAGRISAGAALVPSGALVSVFRSAPSIELTRGDLVQLDNLGNIIGLNDAIAAGLGQIDPRLTPKNPLPLFLARPTGGVNAAAVAEQPVADQDWGSALTECRATDVACLEDTLGKTRAQSPETAKVLAKRDQVREHKPQDALGEAVAAFKQETGRDPAGADFWQFCETRPEARQVLVDLADLVALLREAGARYGDPVESGIEANLEAAKPEGISGEALRAAVEAAGARATK